MGLMEEMRSARRISQDEKTRFITRTYGWMAFALLLSAASAFFTASSPVVLKLIFGHGIAGWAVLAVTEIILVFWLSLRIRKISVAAAAVGFVAYSVINGMTLSSIFFVYRIDSIAMAFFSTAVTFAAMSLYGMRTKRNLMTMGRYLMMALLGTIFASLIGGLISFITKTPLNMLNILISVACVVIFTAMTAYDAQKILKTAEYAEDSADYKKVSILAALELYLDFINLMLALLRLFGKRK